MKKSFSTREYLTGGGQWGDISEATYEWTEVILNQDIPVEALKNLRDDLRDHLEKLNIVIRLFGSYTAANPEFQGLQKADSVRSSDQS